MAIAAAITSLDEKDDICAPLPGMPLHQLQAIFMPLNKSALT
jgi:hypothetical protein